MGTINTAKMEESLKQQRDELTKQKQEEAKRLAQEREVRDKERREQELKSIQAKHNQDKIKQLAQTDIGKKVLGQLDQDTIAQMDADDIMAKQVEELEKEKKELQVRLKAQEKKVDHELTNLLQVPVVAGTVNQGSSVLGGGMVVNDWCAYVGQDTTATEISLIERIFRIGDHAEQTDAGNAMDTETRDALIDTLL